MRVSADEGTTTDRETRTSAAAMLGALTTMLWGGDGEDRVEDTATVAVVREDEVGASASESGGAKEEDGRGEAKKEDGKREKKDGAEGKEGKEGKEEEEEECGFCRFMKGGSCKATFVAWEDCVDAAKDAKEDFVEKCAAQTAALRDCMIANPGYYGDMLEGAGEDDDGDDQLDDQLDDPIDGEKEEEEGEPKQGAAQPKKQASAK